MGRSGWFVVTLAVVAVVGGSAFFAARTGGIEQLGDTSHGAIAVCEKRLLGTLRSPSSYKRISAEYLPGSELNQGEFTAYVETANCPMQSEMAGGEEACMSVGRMMIAYAANMLLEKKGITKPTQAQRNRARQEHMEQRYQQYLKLPPERRNSAFVEIEYDAANAYGTAIREKQICQFGPRTGEKHLERDLFSSMGDERFHRR